MTTVHDRDTRNSQPAFNLTPAQKASSIGMSESWLAKDRLKAEPEVPFKKYGRSVRYSEE